MSSWTWWTLEHINEPDRNTIDPTKNENNLLGHEKIKFINISTTVLQNKTLTDMK